jgi:hypothetical protein
MCLSRNLTWWLRESCAICKLARDFRTLHVTETEEKVRMIIVKCPVVSYAFHVLNHQVDSKVYEVSEASKCGSK